MIILITLICILLALAIFAGAFYLSKFVVRITMRNELLEENYKLAAEHINAQEEKITYLEKDRELLQHDLERAGQPVKRNSNWNPGNPLNMGDRT